MGLGREEYGNGVKNMYALIPCSIGISVYKGHIPHEAKNYFFSQPVFMFLVLFPALWIAIFRCGVFLVLLVGILCTICKIACARRSTLFLVLMWTTKKNAMFACFSV